MTQQPSWNEITRKWMAKNQVTQLNMATRLEVTEGAFAHWLNGRREPKIEVIQEIARAEAHPILKSILFLSMH